METQTTVETKPASKSLTMIINGLALLGAFIDQFVVHLAATPDSLTVTTMIAAAINILLRLKTTTGVTIWNWNKLSGSNCLALMVVCMTFLLSASSSAQFTRPDTPGLFSELTYQQASNGRQFALAPLTLKGERIDLLNQNWLSWGGGGLVGRELLFDDIGNTQFQSMSMGLGAWARIDFGSLGDMKFMTGLSLHALWCQGRDPSYAATLFFGINTGLGD